MKRYDHGCVYFEPFRPQKLRDALELLQTINNLYHKVLIRVGNISHDLLSIESIFPENDMDFEFKIYDQLESASTTLSFYRHAANESLVFNNENLLKVAPGQDQKTKFILFDENCDELVFPNFFLKVKFGIIFYVNII